jgi:hypothetical protein
MMLKIQSILALFLFFWTTSVFGNPPSGLATISGYLKDASSGEALIGATASVKGSTLGVSANEYGFYSDLYAITIFN